MEIRTEDYESLGKFYIGREYNLGAKELEDDLVLYDSKDLVTHGVVLGMTGSGKTGLCISLLEEAAMDSVPAIVIDPKGDIANLLLTFPDLAPEDFRPWINEDDAAKKGITPDEHAAKTADLWRNGLASWGQGSERIQAFRDKIDMSVYTPGSSAGLPVSILSSLDVPEFEVLDDREAFAERIESTVSSLLSLVGNEADPIQDPEHILMSNIFSISWHAGRGVTLESLIREIQVPPFDKIGVMDLDTVCPEKDRRELAMKLNNLLASPGFATWLEGEPLDIKRMMHTPDGKPRISIFSIAHLSDSERMFFVSLLLNQMLGWMRAQSGTTSLRALLYMDEIYGYLPPTAMPPSKKPMMTMLKQARAFGLGVLLATQNPVDLDYKALSNIGTWWLGRLQTERDKARVLDGLEGAAASQDGGFDRGKMEELLAGLGSRVFLMNNVHEDAPVVFHVRWVMSYLTGPLARRQIKQLMDPKREATPPPPAPSPGGEAVAAPAPQAPKPPEPKTARPRLPRGASDFFVPAGPNVPAEEINYVPSVIRVGEVRYQDSRKGISGAIPVAMVNRIDAESGEVNWSETMELPNQLRVSQLGSDPREGAAYSDLPQGMLDSKLWTSLKKEFVDYLYGNHTIIIFKSPMTDLYSALGESEGEFRARLVHAAREVRDEKIDELQDAYEKKMETVEDRIKRAMDVVAEQKAQASSAKVDTAMRVGSTILSAILGRAITTKSRSAMSGASRAWKESQDVARAEEKVEDYTEDLEELQQECEEAIAELKEQMDPMNEKLEEIHLSPLKKNCSVKAVGVVWMPYRVNPEPQLGAAW